MPDLLNNSINIILSDISAAFVYRKLGICYDYRITTANEFPLKTLPKAAEATKSIPSSSGEATGMYDCVLNNTLLFDGYASRLEIGFASSEEDTVFDRLIGGSIRLATIAPKNLIVRGLTGDGRYFYSETDAETVLLWMYTAWRTATTPTVSPESQLKLVNIASRWITKFHNNQYTLQGHAAPLDHESDLGCIKLAAILAANFDLHKKDIWKKEFDEKFTGKFTIPDDATITDLLTTQLALQLIDKIFAEEDEVTAVTRPLMEQTALQAVKFLDNYKLLDMELLNEPSDPDWRKFSTTEGELTTAEKKYINEYQAITTSTLAMFIILHSEALELIKAHAETMSTIIATTPWTQLSLASALTPLASAHAKGVELKIWDLQLNDFCHSFTGESSLVAEFLTADYDENNPDKAGHIKAPKKKPVVPAPPEEENKTGTRKRRKRRKPAKSNAENNTNKEQGTPKNKAQTTEKKTGGGNTQGKRSNYKKRRNRKRRQNNPNDKGTKNIKGGRDGKEGNTDTKTPPAPKE